MSELAKYIREFVEIDSKNFIGVWREYLLVRVTIDIDKPLKGIISRIWVFLIQREGIKMQSWDLSIKDISREYKIGREMFLVEQVKKFY